VLRKQAILSHFILLQHDHIKSCSPYKKVSHRAARGCRYRKVKVAAEVKAKGTFCDTSSAEVKVAVRGRGQGPLSYILVVEDSDACAEIAI
jgi:hypothetical protein